ncbi:hypothetical protein TELCIR_06045 [Teladorsagia circumcincta]|uniref:Protein kinase domain-containing protein n=1 Tax=Teladorsagia circumcincta TaxID=45464 RepID=A0A2G9UP72_TELCI|nr:hypothetical protein TELCIR_06045 [Teladorsagia circumcincta]
MDLALSCGLEDTSQRVEAASYDSRRDQLTVVVASANLNNSKRTVCVYSMAEIDDRFDHIWDICQKTTLHDGGQSVQRVYENCNLHEYSGNSYRYGWLEDFRPFNGNLIANVDTGLENIVSVIPDDLHGALFLAGYRRGSTTLLRVAVPWSLERQTSMSPILWNRQYSPQSRFSISPSKSGDAVFILNETMANLNDNHSEWEIFGSNFDRMENAEVFVCDEKCVINHQLSDKSKTWKVVLAVIVVIIILTVLGVIICLARKKMKSSKEVVDVVTTNFPLGDTFRIRRQANKYDTRLVDFASPYEQMFRDIDDRLKIDASCLQFEAEIGRGHFGIVSRATYTAPDGTKKKVACKVLKHSVDGVGDFILEGLTMNRFDHPHLMQLVGLALTDGDVPILVADFMENGDLRTYLRDDSKSALPWNVVKNKTEGR